MRTVLGLMVIALFAFLGSALFKISRLPATLRALVTSGIAFFFFGVLLGPKATGLLSSAVIEELDVVVNLGVGWAGLLFGLQFRYRDLKRLPVSRYLGGLTESLATLLVIGAGMWAAVWLTPRVWPVWLSVLVLASMGSTTSSNTGIRAIHEHRPHGQLTHTIRLFASLDAVPAVVLIGVALCFSSLHTTNPNMAIYGLLWVGIACGLCMVLGALFHLLTLYHYHPNQLLVIVLGLVVFCSGAAHFLLLSSLFVNMLVGVMVANRSPHHRRVFQSLLRLEKPLFLVLLTLAGAMWSFPPPSVLALVPLFVLLRLLGKLLGGAVATRIAGLTTRGWLGIGPGLLSHDGMAVMIALNVKQFFPGALGDLALAGAIFSILVGALIGPWALLRLLGDEGEVE